ncbi:MAG: helix-turn-helix domain-containing protein [Muribaculaceae bacterium]
MTASEQKFMSMELRRIVEIMREDIVREIRDEIKKSGREIYDTLVNLGIIEDEQRYLTKAQVCKKYRVSKTKVEQLMADGTLPFTKLGDSKQSRVVFASVDCRITFEGLPR